MTELRYGVNYLPSRNWWYAWVDWNDRDIAEDLDVIREMGFDHIRIQCLWPLFQPNPAYVSPVMLTRLVQLLDLAHERGLAVCPTVLDGWLSGFDFRPAWLRHNDPFTDPVAVEAAASLVSEVGRTVAGHPALWCLDVGNEPNVLMRQANLPPGSCDDWAHRMLAAARGGALGVPMTVGVDHEPWLTGDCALTADAVVAGSDLVAIHAWPYFTGALRRFGELEHGAWAIPDYLAQVALAAMDGTRKPLWVQEVGVSELWLEHSTVPDFAERMLRRIASIPEVEAVTWWASHDIDRRFTGFDELEYGLGLIDATNRVKPVGARVRDVIADLRTRDTRVGPGPEALVLPFDTVPDLDFAEQWFAQLRSDAGPRIVREKASAA
ncbi:MAG: cellulase family glycosylhydrolase [Hamadaea sp.]|uniref:glycoside hydrolase 5 family protein n=1 Tax=Hamadaea sp. TaxID=2024425 RepID=UPI0017EFAEAD|nr:cellulase family glycosylhydrolase [Hamadaea sp.]NUT18907.1 cellulase family glycosylhydrolase [Hamadaea sp.]